MKNILFILLCLSPVLVVADTMTPTRRFGAFIGNNIGGFDTQTLRYADRDARSLERIFQIYGGIASEDSQLMINPTKAMVVAHLQSLTLITSKAQNRQELIFYYSGHANNQGLMLDGEIFTYRQLRDLLIDSHMDVKVVILDSCNAGAFARAKGGEILPPFLFDQSNEARGLAFLASSTENENSQEWDTLESAVFTFWLGKALEGEADGDLDGKITLVEAYNYAYAQTRSLTQNQSNTTQNPTYELQIEGAGALVLTDYQQKTSVIHFPESMGGRFSLFRRTGQNVIEFQKEENNTYTLPVSPGEYFLLWTTEDAVAQADFTIAEFARVNLRQSQFTSRRIVDEGLDKGPEEILQETASPTSFQPQYFTILPNPNQEGNLHYFQFSPLVGSAPKGGYGMQLSLAFNQSGPAQIWQLSTLGNSLTLEENTEGYGLQTSFVNLAYQSQSEADHSGFYLPQIGLLNWNEAHSPLQLGAYGYARQSTGLQFSFISVAEEAMGIQAGALTQARRIWGVQAGGLSLVGEALGAQVSLVNFADQIIGGQFGLVNSAQEFIGAQFGLLNMAQKGTGFNLGLITIADEYHGFSLTLIDWIGNGVRNFESNFIFTPGSIRPLLEVGFRFGSPYTYKRFYAIRSLDWESGIGAVGLNLGLRIPMGIEEIGLNLEAGGNVLVGNTENTGIWLAPDLRLTLDTRILDGFGLTVGAKFSAYAHLSFTIPNDTQAIPSEDFGTGPNHNPFQWFIGLQF